MKENVFLIGGLTWYKTLIESLKDTIPNLTVTGNFEQVYAMSKLGEINRLGGFIDAFNYSKSKYDVLYIQKAAEEIHEIDPTIPVLSWGGRDLDKDFKKIPLTYSNEVYLSKSDYRIEEFIDIMDKFYKGTLTAKDIPLRDCLDKNQERF